MAKTLPKQQQAAQGWCRTEWVSGRVPTGNEGRIRWTGQAPLSGATGGHVSRGAVSEKAGGTVSYLTCCAQPGRREGHEDCANSGDADEDEGVEALAGFFRLVVDMALGSTLCGYIAGGFGRAADIAGGLRERRKS